MPNGYKKNVGRSHKGTVSRKAMRGGGSAKSRSSARVRAAKAKKLGADTKPGSRSHSHQPRPALTSYGINLVWGAAPAATPRLSARVTGKIPSKPYWPTADELYDDERVISLLDHDSANVLERPHKPVTLAHHWPISIPLDPHHNVETEYVAVDGAYEDVGDHEWVSLPRSHSMCSLQSVSSQDTTAVSSQDITAVEVTNHSLEAPESSIGSTWNLGNNAQRQCGVVSFAELQRQDQCEQQGLVECMRGPAAVVPNSRVIQSLRTMGFEADTAAAATLATGNESVETAAVWILDRAEEAELESIPTVKAPSVAQDADHDYEWVDVQ
jgi:hypothetical protein